MRKLVLFFAVLFFSYILPAQMNGTYTVDAAGTPSATNYLSVSSAVSDLISGTRADGGPVNGPGVNGPVVIRLETASGPYNEQITITAIAGASPTNTIRITGGPGREMITFSGTTTANRHVIKLDGARHIILDSLSIVNTDATYGYGVQLTNSADSNIVRNSNIITNTTSTSSSFAGVTISGATVASNGDFGDDNLIENNTISGGYYGVTMRGTGTTVFNHRNKVIGNTIQNFYYYGVYCYYQDSTLVLNNVVSARSTGTASGYGIYLNYVDLFRVEANCLFNLGGNGIYGVNANYQGGTGTARSKIINNMIGGAWLDLTSPYGIYFTTNSRHIDIWHNSVSMANGTAARAFYLTSGVGNDVRNNSFAVFGSTTGYAMYISATTYVTAVDYNNYYCPGSSNFIYLGAAYTTATYVGAAGFNVNSRDGDPVYQNNNTNLHSSALQLFDAGTNVGVTTDIDGQSRPMAPTALYDIGADEYVQVLNDAGVTSLTSPVSPFPAGTQNVAVTLFNYGSNTLTSATVNWDVNTVLQTPFAWTGSVSTFTASAPATIGTYNFLAGNTYNLRIWTTNPNGSTDQQNNNDTLYVTVCVALNGTYTVGGVGADYPTLSSAVAAAACGGVAGPVTFRLTAGAGPFVEQVNIPTIPGTSAVNTLRITGGPSRETVTFASSNTNERATIKINGANYIILDSLTINATGTTYGYGVQITNSSDYNIVRNCVINVSTTATGSGIAGITMSGASVTTAGDNGDNNVIEYNTVNGGYYGITMRGPSTTVFNQNNIIRGNTINNVYYYGIYSYSQTSPLITQNSVSARPTASASGYGIYCYYNDLFTISRNDLDSIGQYGIYMYYGNYQGGTGTGRALCENNSIGGTWRSATPYGMYVTTNTRNVDFWHNSVSLNSGNGRCIYILSGSGNNVQNNSFAYTNSATGYAMYVTSAAYVNGIDYNNYYAPGSSNFIYIAGAYSTATYVGGGGFNVNSRDGDPGYLDPAYDLHASGPQLYDAGANLGVTQDIDGDARPLAPSTGYDIGADEFLVAATDNEVAVILTPMDNNCADSNATVSVIITNNGLGTITTMPMTAQITGYTSATLNYTYTGSLAFGQSDTVIIGTFNSHSGGTLNVVVYSTLPGDMNSVNDTVSTTVNIIGIAPVAVGTNDTVCENRSASLTVNTDGNWHSWYDAPTAGNLLASGDTFNTPTISATTTYYVESASTTNNSLTTQYSGGNGCNGSMFDIIPAVNMTVDSFAVNIGSTVSETVRIYVCTMGSYAGNETNPGAWQLAGLVNVVAQGAGQPTMIPIGGINMTANQTYGIYVALVSSSLDYTTGSQTFTNGDMSIVTGAGLCGNFASVNAGRIFNGTVYYRTQACPNPVRTPITVSTVAPAIVSLGNDTNACDVIQLDAGNIGYNYTWSTADTTQQISVTASGQYSVAVSDQYCTSRDTINITINTSPTLVASAADGNLCFGESDTMFVSGAMLYTWSSGGIGTSEPVMPFSTTTYTVNGVDSNGCGDTATVTIIVNPLPNVSVTLPVDTTCLNSGMITLGGESPSGGTWSGPAVSGNMFDPATAGTGTWAITYDYTDANGCRDTAMVNMVVNTVPTVTVSLPIDTACLTGGMVMLSGESPAGGTWSGPAVSGSMFDPATAGIGTWAINYDYTDANGCIGTATDSIFVDPCLDVTSAGANTTSLNVYPNPNNGAFYLQLSGEGTMIVTVFDAIGQVISSERKTAGTYTMELNAAGAYLITAEDENGNRTMKTVIVD